MEQVQIVTETLRMIRRRFLLLFAVVVLGVVGSIFFALLKPPVYETSAKILIESQQIPNDLARSTVNLSAAERVQLIEQRLVARDNLIAVIDRLDLFDDLPDLTLNDKIGLFREAIQFETVPVSGRESGANVEIFAFTITVRLDEAEKAAEVVNEFVESAVEQNVRLRAERARETLVYFEREAERVEEEIAALEEEIGAFKNLQQAALPENLQYRRDELARLEESDMEIERRILELEEEHGALELALSGDRPLRTEEPMPQSPEETALRTLAMDLAQKRQVLAPNHPEILRLEGRLLALTALIPTTASESGVSLNLEDASAAQRSAAERQTARLDSQLSLLQDQRRIIADRREALDASILRTPEVEVALNAFNRRLRELQDQYSVITQRRAEARTGEELETSQQSERFQVIENATVPDHPIEPKRKQIVALGSGGSVVLGFGLIFLLEMMRPVLRSSAQMERQLDLRPVISIPYVSTAAERRRRRLAWAGGFALLVGGSYLALPLVETHVMPLEVIQERIAEMVGFEGLLGLAEAES